MGYRHRSTFFALQIQKIRFQTTEYDINIAFYRLKLMEIPLLTSFGFGSPKWIIIDTYPKQRF